jgi:hypothetical protein
MLGITFFGQFKRVTQNPVDPFTRENRFLHNGLSFSPGIDTPANLRILAFVVFSHNQKINVRGSSASQG